MKNKNKKLAKNNEPCWILFRVPLAKASQLNIVSFYPIHAESAFQFNFF